MANPPPPEAAGAQDISSNGNSVSCTSGHSAAGAASNGTAVAVRKAGSAAIATKRALERQAEPAAKRQKAVSKESQAAMAAIAATARLPTQVIAFMPLRLKYLPLSRRL